MTVNTNGTVDIPQQFSAGPTGILTMTSKVPGNGIIAVQSPNL